MAVLLSACGGADREGGADDPETDAHAPRGALKGGHHGDQDPPKWGKKKPHPECDDDCSFAVVSMTPPPESAIAVPNGVIELEFSEGVDPSSVSAATVVLRERESKRTVPLSFDVDGSHVTLIPDHPLGRRSRFWVEVDGVTSAAQSDDDSGQDDDDDEACTASYNARFFTAPNFETLYLRYTNGIENRAVVYEWDDALRQLVVDFYVPSADGQFLTDDDVQDFRSIYYYDPVWDLTRAHVWNGAGADAVWGTADDSNYSETKYTYIAAGLETYFIESYGADGIIGTADDSASLVNTYLWDDADENYGYCNTDMCVQEFVEGDVVRTVSLVAPGPDGVWMTGDDVLASQWSRSLPLGPGLYTQEVHATAADGTATVTATSLKSYSDIIAVDALTRETRSYKGPGPDGTWRTPDDLGDSITTTTFDTDGLRVSSIVYLAGPDGLLDTGDDVIYQEFYY